jgi:hypothetical protein
VIVSSKKKHAQKKLIGKSIRGKIFSGTVQKIVDDVPCDNAVN